MIDLRTLDDRSLFSLDLATELLLAAGSNGSDYTPLIVQAGLHSYSVEDQLSVLGEAMGILLDWFAELVEVSGQSEDLRDGIARANSAVRFERSFRDVAFNGWENSPAVPPGNEKEVGSNE